MTAVRSASRSDHRLVCCVLPKGEGHPLLDRLFRDKGITRADVHSARGFLGSDPRKLLDRVEKDFLSVVVERERADEVFEWLYHEARVAEEVGRFLYVTRLSAATPFALPTDLPFEGGR